MLSRNVFRPAKMVARLRKLVLQHRAIRHRLRIGREQSAIRWIGVTGSCGKSTTCQILAKVLASHGACAMPNVRWNYTGTVPLSILRVTTDDRYVVQEIATHVPGSIERICKMFRPEIAIVMNVGTDHYSQFGSQEAIANEKAALVRALPADGVAVLNADDPQVAAMASATMARTVTFGIENAASYRAHDVSSAWPCGVSFDLEHDGARYAVETQLYGAHFALNVLASLAAAHVAGMPLEEAVAVVGSAGPVPGRMSEVKVPGGATFIRDDLKAPWWALSLTIDFLRGAQAKRRVLVLGEMSDNPGGSNKFRRFINLALEHVELLVVTGPAAGKLNKSLGEHPKLQVCHTVADANDFLRGSLASGDLVVLKGRLEDHLERLAHSHTGNVGCWRSRCGRTIQCSACDLLEMPAAADEPVKQQ